MAHACFLVTATVLNTKMGEVENKILDHAKYIFIQKFNKLTAENFTTGLNQAIRVSQSNFDNKLTSFKRKIT